MKSLLITAGMLLLIYGIAVGEETQHALTPRLSLLGGQLFFSEEREESYYGSMTMCGVRIAFDTHGSVEPFMGASYGRGYGEYPDRITTLWLSGGLRVKVVERAPFRFYVGGSLLALHSAKRLIYSPCMPGAEAVREYGFNSVGCQLLGGPEWLLASQRVSIGLEFAYTLASRGMRGSTAVPSAPSVSGYLVEAYMTLGL